MVLLHLAFTWKLVDLACDSLASKNSGIFQSQSAFLPPPRWRQKQAAHNLMWLNYSCLSARRWHLHDSNTFFFLYAPFVFNFATVPFISYPSLHLPISLSQRAQSAEDKDLKSKYKYERRRAVSCYVNTLLSVTSSNVTIRGSVFTCKPTPKNELWQSQLEEFRYFMKRLAFHFSHSSQQWIYTLMRMWHINNQVQTILLKLVEVELLCI